MADSSLKNQKTPIERFTYWMGSVPSLIVHTLVFASALASGFLNVAPWDLVLLILTTAVSLEAIYLAIFIQMTVNKNTESLREVEEDVEDIQEGIEDIGEDIEGLEKDMDEIQEDVDEIQEDIEELSEEEEADDKRKQAQSMTLEAITANLQKLLEDVETLKKGR